MGASGGSVAAKALSDDRSELLAWIKQKLPPEGSVLVADSADALAQMLDDGVDLPIYTKRFGGEYDPRPATSKPLPIAPRKNDVNAPRGEGESDHYVEYDNFHARNTREEKEDEWRQRILNDPESLADNEELLEKALADFGEGSISNQTLDIAFLLAGAPVSGTEEYLARKAHAAEMEKQVEALRVVAVGSAESLHRGEGADPRLTAAYKAKVKEAMAGVVEAQNAIKGIEANLALNKERRAEAEEYRKGLDDAGRANHDAFIARNTNDAPWNEMLVKAQAKLAEQIKHLEKVNEQVAREFAPQIAAQEARYDEILKDSILTPEERTIAKQKALLAAAAEVPRDFWELWGSSEFWKGKTPFAGDVVQLFNLLSVAETVGKLENEADVSPQELALLHETMIELNRPNTFMANVLDTTTGAASLAVELATTAGLYTAVKKGALTLAQKGLEKLLTKAGRKIVEEMMAKRALEKQGVRLFTYQAKRPFVGSVLKTGPWQGRLWATRHGPASGWYFRPGMKNTLLRMWRTGRPGPYNTFKEITGPAAKQYTKVQGVGPLRLLKRFGGQYYTSKPGDLNLKTGRFLDPSGKQRFLRYWDSVASYGFDIGAVGVGSWLLSVATDDFDDLNLPPIELPTSKKDSSNQNDD